MKKLLPLLACTFLLTGCTQTLRFLVTVDTQDLLLTKELHAAIPRMIEGRMLAKKKKVVEQSLEQKDGSTILTVTVSDREAAEMLQDGLDDPFSMTIMKQVEKGMGDIVSEKFGEFKETGITTEHFERVAAGTMTGADGQARGTVVITFTDEGKKLLADLFAKNTGKIIGIFVRGQLMSKKTIEASDKKLSVISVDGIPTPAVAAAFADDVNVGLHVTFTPAQ